MYGYCQDSKGVYIDNEYTPNYWGNLREIPKIVPSYKGAPSYSILRILTGNSYRIYMNLYMKGAPSM